MPRPAVSPALAVGQALTKTPMTRTESTSVSSDDNIGGAAGGERRKPSRRWRTTAPRTSRFSRVSTRSASARACTSDPPVWPACTTWSGRSSTTPSTRRWPASHAASTSRCCADGGCRVDDNGRGIPVDPYPSGRTRASPRPRSSSPCCTPAASSVARATRSPAACTASASASSTRCRAARCSRSTATASTTSGVRQGRQATGQARGRRPDAGRGRKSGTTITFWPDPTVFAPRAPSSSPAPCSSGCRRWRS